MELFQCGKCDLIYQAKSEKCPSCERLQSLQDQLKEVNDNSDKLVTLVSELRIKVADRDTLLDEADLFLSLYEGTDREPGDDITILRGKISNLTKIKNRADD